jgi:hypothetical protein
VAILFVSAVNRVLAGWAHLNGIGVMVTKLVGSGREIPGFRCLPVLRSSGLDQHPSKPHEVGVRVGVRDGVGEGVGEGVRVIVGVDVLLGVGVLLAAYGVFPRAGLAGRGVLVLCRSCGGVMVLRCPAGRRRDRRCCLSSRCVIVGVPGRRPRGCGVCWRRRDRREPDSSDHARVLPVRSLSAPDRYRMVAPLAMVT